MRKEDRRAVKQLPTDQTHHSSQKYDGNESSRTAATSFIGGLNKRVGQHSTTPHLHQHPQIPSEQSPESLRKDQSSSRLLDPVETSLTTSSAKPLHP